MIGRRYERYLWIGAMIILSAYLLIWIWQGYQKEVAMIRETIAEALISADYSELTDRMTKARKAEKEMMEAKMRRETSGDETNEEVSYSKKRRLVLSTSFNTNSIKQQAEINYPNDSAKDLKIEAQSGHNLKPKQIEDFLTVGQLTYKAMHLAIDSIKPIHLAIVDSILKSTLEHKGLYVNHRIFITRIHGEPKHIDQAEMLSLDKRAPQPESNPLASSTGDIKYAPVESFPYYHIASWISANSEQYLYPYELYGRYAYYLQVEGIGIQALRNMMGIIIITSITLIILFLSFIHLSRTIKHLARLKEMQQNFTHNITHELKTPLSVAVAAQEALIDTEHPIPVEKKQQYIRIIGTQLEQLGKLINQILMFGKLSHQAPPTSCINIQQTLASSVKDFALRLPPHATFKVELPAALDVFATEQALQMMVHALLDNALKYSEDKIHITLKAYQRKRGETIIEVQEQGKGIAPDALPYIFERFYRVAEGDIHHARGYGLGLSYVKEQMAQYQGTVEVESQEHRGSIFRLVFHNTKN